jgi:hypothetical protein
MVASLVLALGVIGIVSMLRASRDLEYGIQLSRNARILAESKLEQYPHSAYSALPVISLEEEETLDPRETSPLIAKVVTLMGAEAPMAWSAGISNRSIRVTVSWPKPSYTDSIVVAKRIVKLK